MLTVFLLSVSCFCGQSDKVAFDESSLEKTAVYLSRWQTSLRQAERKAEFSGNAIEYQELLKKFRGEAAGYEGKEVKWQLRFEGAYRGQFGDKITIAFQTEQVFPKLKAGVYMGATIDDAKIEPWMKSLRKGQLVNVTARIDSITEGPRIVLEQVAIVKK